MTEREILDRLETLEDFSDLLEKLTDELKRQLPLEKCREFYDLRRRRRLLDRGCDEKREVDEKGFCII